VRACKRLSEAAKTLTARDHVRGISGPSTLFNTFECAEIRQNTDTTTTPPLTLAEEKGPDREGEAGNGDGTRRLMSAARGGGWESRDYSSVVGSRSDSASLPHCHVPHPPHVHLCEQLVTLLESSVGGAHAVIAVVETFAEGRRWQPLACKPATGL
jgi:hypothetical protein